MRENTRDLRDPKAVGHLLEQFKTAYPEKTASERMDMIEEVVGTIGNYDPGESTVQSTMAQYKQEMIEQAAQGDRYARRVCVEHSWVEDDPQDTQEDERAPVRSSATHMRDGDTIHTTIDIEIGDQGIRKASWGSPDPRLKVPKELIEDMPTVPRACVFQLDPAQVNEPDGTLSRYVCREHGTAYWTPDSSTLPWLCSAVFPNRDAEIGENLDD